MRPGPGPGQRAALAALAFTVLAALALLAAAPAALAQDTTAPSFSKARVDGTRLVVFFDESLDSASAPAGDTFSVVATVAGTDTTIAGTGTASIAAATATVTLASAVASTATVTVGYTKPTTGNKLRDTADTPNEVATFTAQTATNDPAPWFRNATVNGKELKVNFDENLDTTSTPAGTTLSVSASTTAADDTVTTRTIAGTGTASIAAATVTVTLASAVKRTETATLGYTKPTSNPLEDAADNAVATFSAETVTVNSMPPFVESAAVLGDDLTLTFNVASPSNARLTSGFVLKQRDSGEAAEDAELVAFQHTSFNTGFAPRILLATMSRDITRGKIVTLSYTPPANNPIQDSKGNVMESLSGMMVTNNTESSQPLFVSAAVNGASLVLTYSHSLLASSKPAASAFTVTVGDTERSVSDVAIAAKKVTLTLASAVTPTDTVKVRYTKPSSNPLKSSGADDFFGYQVDAPTFDNQDVTNNTPDTTAPAFSSATVDGKRLVVTFDESPDTASAPAGSAFSVVATVGGTPTTIAGTGTVTIAGTTVTVTLTSAPASTATVTVGYTKPTTGNKLRDTATTPNEVATFSGESVTNNTAAPTFSSAAVDGRRLTVTFNENLDTESAPQGSTFEVTATESATDRTIAGTGTATISGATASVTLASVVKTTETLKVGYEKPTSGSKLRDLGENEAATFSDETTTNSSVPPTVSSAAVSGLTLTVTFSEAVALPSAFPVAAFTVSAGGIERTGGVLASSNTTSPDIRLKEVPVAPGDTVTLSYTKPGSDPVTDTAGNELASFSGQPVTNDTPTDAAPVFYRATVNGASLMMTFNASLKTTSTPATSAFTVTVGATTRNVSDVSIAGKTVTLTLASAVLDTDTVKVRYAKPATGDTLQGSNDTDVASFADQDVGNNTADIRAPSFESATVNGASLAVTFDEALDTASTPAGGAFKVSATAPGGTARTIAGTGTVTIAEATPTVATVTLASVVTAADTVQVRYDKPGSNPLRDANANEVATFGLQAAANATAPVFGSATVNGDTLTMTFNADLDETVTAPVPGDFFVTVGTERRNVDTGGVNVSGKAVTLTLASAVTAADTTVKVRYTKPGTDPLQGSNGTAVETFADQAVTNATPPAFVSATVNGAALTVTFDVDLDTNSVPAPGDFFATVAGSRRPVDAGGVEVSGKTVTLTLGSAVTPEDPVQVRYTKPTSSPLKGSGNDAAVETFPDQAVTNATPPVLASAAVNRAALTVTFDVDLDTNSTPAASAFTVTVVAAGGTTATRTVNTVAIDLKTVTLTLASAVTDTDTVKVRYAKPSNNPLQANFNHAAVETFADQEVDNETDTTAPTFVRAAVDGTTLTMTFNEALDPGSVPDGSDFTVTVGGTGRAVNSVLIDAATPTQVTLTLASAVTLTDTVKVRYTKPSGSPLQDPVGNQVATLTDQDVTNATAPVFESAAVNGDALTVTFDEALDASSVPAPGDFFVTVQGRRRNVATNGVSISAATVTLTLASAVTEGEVVLVRYTQPTSNPLQDLAGHAVATFADQDVDNHTDSTAPTFRDARVTKAALTLTFDEALDETSAPVANTFTVTVRPAIGDPAPRTVRRVAVSAETVILTLASAVRDTDGVDVRYTEPTAGDKLQDGSGNPVATFADQFVTNHTADEVAPHFQSAEVDGTALTLVFDEALEAGAEPAPRAFTVTVAGKRRAVAASGVHISGERVILALASAAAAGEAVTVRYARPSGKPLADAAGNRVASFGPHRAANVTVDNSAPGFKRASVNGAVLTVTFDEALDPGSVPVPGAFTVSVGGVRRATVADDLGSGGRRAVAIAGATAVLRLVTPVTDTAVVTVRYTQPGSDPLRDGAGNTVATFADQPVSNDTSARLVFVSAAVNGANLDIAFSRPLVAPPHDGTVSVNVSGTVRSAKGRATSGVIAEMLLDPPVTHRDTVTLSYTKPATGSRLRDTDDNPVESFSNKPVANLTPDEAPPVQSGAVVRGTTLTLTFDEALDANARPPAASAFTIAGTETATTVVAVAFHPTNDTRLLLTLSQAVASGPTVMVSYTRPAGSPLRDRAGNEVADFANAPLRAPPSPPPPPPPPPPPVLHTAPSFDGGDTAHLSIVRRHADRAPVGIVAATDADGDPLAYSLAGDDRALFTIDATGLIAVATGTALAGEGRDLFTVTAEVSDGENALGLPEPEPAVDDTIEVTVTLTDTRDNRVALVPSASDPLRRQGFVRVVNHSGEAGDISILAIDDDGMEYGPTTLDLGARQTVHFNSRDLEQGNPGKGLADGTGPGEGHWRLVLTSALDLQVLSYIRTADGFVTSMHDLAPSNEAGHRVVFVNPGSNRRQVSWLRLVNPGEAPADITITGTDDAGEPGESAVELTLGAGASRSVTAQALESGEDLRGRLGDGKGKWRLHVSGTPPVRVMSLLASPTGHLTNLSATPGRKATGGAAVSHRVPLAPSASDPHYRQGFVRVANHSAEAGEVSITAIDDPGMEYGPVRLDIEAHRTVHLNSDDLEQGNPTKGLEDGIGPGEGNWRLVLTSALDLEVLSYIRTDDGFVTSMHEVAPESEAGHRVVFFNPGSNRNQVSWLRLVNPGETPADITITSTDDAGEAGEGPVTLTLPARASRALSAEGLESGEGAGLTGRLGDGKGKWRLDVSASQPIRVMSLLSSPTGHLTNLSAAPGRP